MTALLLTAATAARPARTAVWRRRRHRRRETAARSERGTWRSAAARSLTLSAGELPRTLVGRGVVPLVGAPSPAATTLIRESSIGAGLSRIRRSHAAAGTLRNVE